MIASETEQRSEVRQTCVLKARILSDGHQPLECLVTDKAEGGAQIMLSPGIDVPDSFVLFVPTESERRRVSVKWRKGEMVGLKYEDAAEEHAPAFEEEQSPSADAAMIAALKDRLEMLEARYHNLTAAMHKTLNLLEASRAMRPSASGST